MANKNSNVVQIMEDFALTPVPMNQRKHLYSVFATLTGFVISPTAFLLGTSLSKGVTLNSALLAILLGNIIVACCGFLSGLIGQSTGLTTYLNSRIVYGRIGAAIPSCVIGITVMAIVGSLFGTVGQAVNAMFPVVPVWMAQVIFAVAITLTSIFGFKGLAWLSAIAVPSLVVLGFLALWIIATSEGGLSSAFAKMPEQPISFGTALSAVITTWITGVSMVSDIGRYAKKTSHIAFATFGGWIVGAVVFESIAVIAAIATGSGNFVNMMSSIGLLIPAFLVFFLSMWTTADNNIWSFTLAFSNIGDIVGIKLPRAFWDIVASSIALIFGLLGFANKFGELLRAIAVFSPPIAGVMISHFFLLGYRRKIMQKKNIDIVSFRWQAFAAWIAGAFIASAWSGGVPALQGLIASALAYWLIALATGMKDKEESQEEAAHIQELAV